jgi:GAF domain-containing protein
MSLAMSPAQAELDPRSGPTPLDRIAELAVEPSLRGAVEAVRQILGVEVAYATRHTATDQVLETVDGDGELLEIAEGESVPLEMSYCQRVIDGEMPPLVPDVDADPAARQVAAIGIARFGAFASVPLTLSDGSRYGTLCCGSPERQPHWRERDLRFMHVIARILADQIDREMLLRDRSRAEVQATAVSALISAVDARDGYTAEHSRAVVEHSVATA